MEGTWTTSAAALHAPCLERRTNCHEGSRENPTQRTSVDAGNVSSQPGTMPVPLLRGLENQHCSINPAQRSGAFYTEPWKNSLLACHEITGIVALSPYGVLSTTYAPK